MLIAIPGGEVFRGDHQTFALARASIDHFYDVDDVLAIVHRPVDLVVIAGGGIHHDVLVAEEEHHGARVVKLIHVIEIGHLCDVHEVDNAEIAHILGEGKEHLVLLHALGVIVVPEANQDHLLLLRHDGLVHGPRTAQVWKHVTHFSAGWLRVELSDMRM